MPDWSRRRALHALGTAAAAALAGCSGEEESGFEEPPGDRRGDPVTDYEVHRVREPPAGPLFWRGERSRNRAGGHLHVAEPADLEDVTFADRETAAELAAFVRETDLETESVVVQSRAVRECYELRLSGVWRDGDDFETSFCSELRPADVACGRD
ncbi:hypothetical protein, partial [Halobacterium sp. CBA1126]